MCLRGAGRVGGAAGHPAPPRGQRADAHQIGIAAATQQGQRRIDQALTELSKRVGFRIASGLSERVIYRELFPSGLTLLDKGHLGELGTSHLVARQELRTLVMGLNLPVPAKAAPPVQPQPPAPLESAA